MHILLLKVTFLLSIKVFNQKFIIRYVSHLNNIAQILFLSVQKQSSLSLCSSSGGVIQYNYESYSTLLLSFFMANFIYGGFHFMEVIKIRNVF